jgi:hypothetical protein
MKQGSTLFLKGVVALIGLTVLALCVLVLPAIAREIIDFMPVQYELIPVLIAIAASVIPFYIALYKTWTLLNFIDKNKAFSELSVRALKNIKSCGIAIGLLYLACAPFLFIIADGGDAPGVFAVGLIIMLASIVVTTATGVFQRLLQNALDIKSENDLTV